MRQNTCEIIPYFHSSPFDYTYLLYCNLRDYTVYSRNCEKINNVQSLKKLPTCLPYLHVISAVYLFCLFTCFSELFYALLFHSLWEIFVQKLTFDTAIIVKPFSGYQKEWKLLKNTVSQALSLTCLIDCNLFRYGLKDFFPLTHDN